MNVHKNVRLTPKSRAELVRRISGGQSRSVVAMAFGICARTAAKWFRRYCDEGEAGLVDRPSRPRRLRKPTSRERSEQVIELRATRIPGKEIAHRLGLSAATVRGLMRDGLVLSRRRPSNPSSAKRSCQRHTQVLDLSVRRMISLVPKPSALSTTIRQHQTCFWGALRSSTTPIRRRRSAGEIVMGIPVRMRQTRTPSTKRESQIGFKCQILSTRMRSAR